MVFWASEPLENFLSKKGLPDALQAILVGIVVAIGFGLIVFVQRKILGTTRAAKILTPAGIGALVLLAAFLDYLSLGHESRPWLAAIFVLLLGAMAAILGENKTAPQPRSDSSETS